MKKISTKIIIHHLLKILNMISEQFKTFESHNRKAGPQEPAQSNNCYREGAEPGTTSARKDKSAYW
jgi:hypothetical protein